MGGPDGGADRAPEGDLDGALDCDLGLCPFTNTMPILRHGLETARPPGEVDVELAMAWVSVPDLTVSASPQRYRSGGSGAGGRARVRFDSEGFGAPVEVDAHGFVVDYPGIGHRLELGWRITLLPRLRPDRSSASSRRGDRPDPRDRLAPGRRRAGGEVDQRDPDRF